MPDPRTGVASVPAEMFLSVAVNSESVFSCLFHRVKPLQYVHAVTVGLLDSPRTSASRTKTPSASRACAWSCSLQKQHLAYRFRRFQGGSMPRLRPRYRCRSQPRTDRCDLEVTNQVVASYAHTLTAEHQLAVFTAKERDSSGQSCRRRTLNPAFNNNDLGA